MNRTSPPFRDRGAAATRRNIKWEQDKRKIIRNRSLPCCSQLRLPGPSGRPQTGCDCKPQNLSYYLYHTRPHNSRNIDAWRGRGAGHKAGRRRVRLPESNSFVVRLLPDNHSDGGLRASNRNERRVYTHLSPPRKRGSRKTAARVDSRFRGNDTDGAHRQIVMTWGALRMFRANT
jgi:hypothetical protein